MKHRSAQSGKDACSGCNRNRPDVHPKEHPGIQIDGNLIEEVDVAREDVLAGHLRDETLDFVDVQCKGSTSKCAQPRTDYSQEQSVTDENPHDAHIGSAE